MPSPTLADLEAKYFIPAFGGPRHSGDVVVTPHVDGEAYFGAIADALDKCLGPGDKIYIASWLFSPEIDLRSRAGMTGPGPSLGKILFDKASRGADVRIVVGTPMWSSGTEGLNPVEDQFWMNKLVKFLGEGIDDIVENNIVGVLSLRQTGNGSQYPFAGKVLMDWSGIDPDPRHEKTTIIYSAATKELRAFVGGIDYDPGRISNPLHAARLGDGSPTWHDAGIEIYGSAAASVLDNFITRWIETATLPPRRYKLALADGTKIDEEFNPLVEPSLPSRPTNAEHPPAASGRPSVCILRSYEGHRAITRWRRNKVLNWHTLPGPVLEIRDVLRQAIANAGRYIYVEDQTLNSPAGWKADWFKHDELYPLISAACARGVKVIFVCHDAITSNGNPTMSWEIRQKIIAPLLTSEMSRNFGLYWIEGVRLHSKIVIVDDEFASIGSANFWDRSMYGFENELNAAFVHTGGESSQAADLRVRLWLEHLRIPGGSNVTAQAEIRDLGTGLGVFRSDWALSSPSFSCPASVLREISP
jgi:hypothetical protein